MALSKDVPSPETMKATHLSLARGNAVMGREAPKTKAKDILFADGDASDGRRSLIRLKRIYNF
jgi:hypothetical protein